MRRAEEAARKREAAEAPTQRVSDRDDRDELRAAYDAMLQRDGAPLNPASAETEQIAVIEKKPKVKKRRRWMWWVFTPVALLLALGACGLIFYNQAMDVRDDLTTMKGELNVLLDQVKVGDTAASDKTAAHIAELSARSNATVDTLLWDVAANVPFIGANVEAVAETTKAVDIVIREALPSVTQLISTFDIKGSKLEGGGIDLQPFRDAQPMLPALSATLAKAQEHIDKIDRDDLIPFVEENISQVADMITQATPLIQLGEKYLPTILNVLGDGTTRTYALIIQNNAEIHTTGGNPGNTAIISVSNGAITMREDEQVINFTTTGYSGTGFEDIGPVEKADLFEWDSTLFVANFTRFPEFNDTVYYFEQLWQSTTGGTLDGVISIDPVVLSYMLAVTGPVDVPGYRDQVTQENTVPMLLSEAYEDTSGGLEAQQYFNAIASAIFTKFAAGGWDPLKMYTALQEGVAQQRVYMHFTDPTEQQMVEDGGMGGHVELDYSKVAQTGIYLNNASFSKLEYYLTTSVAVTCDAGARTITTSTTMNNNVPHGDLSNYTLGGRNKIVFGIDRTTMLLDVLSFAMPGGQLVGWDPAGGSWAEYDRDGNYNGRQGHSMLIDIPMGESRTVSYTSTVPEGVTVPLQVRYSPTVTDTPVTIQDSCGQLFPGTVTTGP